MKCTFCDSEIRDGQRYFDPTQVNLYMKVWNRNPNNSKFLKLYALCEECAEELFITYDKVGEEANE